MPKLAKTDISRSGPRVLSRWELREKPFPDAPGRTMDPAAVEAEIDRLERENERAADEYELHAVALSRAEHAWKLAEAREIAEGYANGVPVSASQKIALVEHWRQHREYLDAKAALDAIDKRCWAITHSLEALRSLNANARGQGG